MRGRLLKLLQDIRGSYWFVPSIMVAAAILLAMVTDSSDVNVDTSFLANIPWLYQNQPAGARAVLSAIATSLIGVAGVTFSMTLVAVSFAASNIGPRLISNFMLRAFSVFRVSLNNSPFWVMANMYNLINLTRYAIYSCPKKIRFYSRISRI